MTDIGCGKTYMLAELQFCVQPNLLSLTYEYGRLDNFDLLLSHTLALAYHLMMKKEGVNPLTENPPTECTLCR